MLCLNRKCPRGLPSLSILCLAVLTIIATAQAQTFQYSRGWTNGKRSGLASPIGLLDLENGYLNPEMSELSLLPGHLQMNLSPQARLRTLDYNQVRSFYICFTHINMPPTCHLYLKNRCIILPHCSSQTLRSRLEPQLH